MAERKVALMECPESVRKVRGWWKKEPDKKEEVEREACSLGLI